MMKKKLWLIVIGVVAIAFSANAFAMMSGNNGYNNHSQRYGFGGYHMNDDNRGPYRGNYRNFHNGNNYGSHMDGYNGSYHKDSREHYREGYRYRENHRYQRD